MSFNLLDQAAQSNNPLVPGFVNAMLKNGVKDGGLLPYFLPLVTLNKLAATGLPSDEARNVTTETIPIGSFDGYFKQVDLEAYSRVFNQRLCEIFIRGRQKDNVKGLRGWVDEAQILKDYCPDLEKSAKEDLLLGLDYVLEMVAAYPSYNTLPGFLVMSRERVEQLKDDFVEKDTPYGFPLYTYRDVPILPSGIDNPEVYAVRMGEGDGLVLLQYAPLDVRMVSPNPESATQFEPYLGANWFVAPYLFKKNALAMVELPPVLKGES